MNARLGYVWLMVYREGDRSDVTRLCRGPYMNRTLFCSPRVYDAHGTWHDRLRTKRIRKTTTWLFVYLKLHKISLNLEEVEVCPFLPSDAMLIAMETRRTL